MSSSDQASSTPEPSSTSSSNATRNRGAGTRRRQQRVITSNPTSYAGQCEDIGVILALRSERFDKKVQFQVFMEKMDTYVISNFKDGGDIQSVFTELKDPTDVFQASNKPMKPEQDDLGEVDEVDKEIYKEEVKQFVQRKINLRRNMEKSYGLVWGQCSSGLKQYIKGLATYEPNAKTFDIVWLLKELKKATVGIDDKANSRMNMHRAIMSLYKMKQGTHETNDHFLDRFQSNITALELAGGAHLFVSPTITGNKVESMSDAEILKEADKSQATLLLSCSDDGRFGDLVESLNAGMLRGRDEYPETMANMYQLMIKHANPLQNVQTPSSNRRRQAVTLVQASHDDETPELIPGTDGRTFDIQCFNCNQRGHYAANCPEPSNRTGVSNLQFGNVLAQVQACEGMIPPDWVLLDTCSTDNVISNIELMESVRSCTDDETLRIYTNGGSLEFNEIGNLKHFPMKGYYNPKSIANVLSLKAVGDLDGYYLTMNTKNKPGIYVEDGKNKLLFRHSQNGLFHCTLRDLKNFFDPPDPLASSSINLLSSGINGYAKAEVKRATQSRELQECLLWPSDSAMKIILKNNNIVNTGLAPEDVDRASNLFGVSKQIAAGKMIAHPQKSNKSTQILLHDLVPSVSRRLKMYIDILYINGKPYLHTKTKDVNYITINKLQSRKARDIKRKLKPIIKKYLTRGFIITDVFGDNEFSSPTYETLFLPATLHVCSKGEHVPIIERSVRTIKERARAASASLPYDRVPSLMTVSLLEGVERWLNTFASGSHDHSPITVVEGRSPPRGDVQRIPYGAYAEVYVGTKNTLESRTVPGIALRESNGVGGHYFMSLETGRRIHANKWSRMVITEDIISKVQILAENEGQPWIHHDPFSVKFLDDTNDIETYQVGELVEENDTDEVEDQIDEVEERDLQQIEERVEVAIDQLDDLSTGSEEESSNGDMLDEWSSGTTLEASDSTYKPEENESEEIEITQDLSTVNSGDFSFNIAHAYADEDNEDQHPIGHLNEEIDEGNDASMSSYSDSDLDIPAIELMNKSKSNEGVQLFNIGIGYEKALNVMFTQMSARKGIKLFGEQAIAAMFKELKQLNDGVVPGKPVIEPIKFESLTEENKQEALEAVNLIAQKRCGRIKGRTCANGSRQRRFLREDESFASPTASLEAIMTTLMIDAYEKRDVAVADVPGAYLHAEFPVNKQVILKLNGVFVDIMCDVNPEYRQHIIYETSKKGRKIKCLYVKVLRALYGCLESALLWYELYSTTLTKLGFKINDYDRCVANKIINGKQCTIVFYVDDNKISHQDPQVVTDVIKEISNHFGELTVSRGVKHDYLGMDIEIKDSLVYIGMRKQLEEALEWGGVQGGRMPATPAKADLFNQGQDEVLLDDTKADVYHSVVQKLMYVCKRARPDIEPALSYLCTKVSRPTNQDQDKLNRLLDFIRGTLDDRRVIGATSLNEMVTWVDAAFASHMDKKSHTGGTISFGVGVVHSKSGKQKLNTKSSTEAELVGVSDYLPYHIWIINFLQAQGYNIKKKTLYQDNQSAIKMERNGRNSCTGNSRHIDIRYFFVHDRVKTGQIEVIYCPTERMVADFFTKPLQGKVFNVFRNAIMGYDMQGLMEPIKSVTMKN